MRAVFRCDANAQIGGGHVMRCLTLANSLAEAGASATFVAAEMPSAFVGRIAAAGHRFERIVASPEMRREGEKWEEPPLGLEAQRADAEATGAAVGRTDWVIVDQYLLDSRWHSVARNFARQILVIDELANRTCDCEILLDQTFGRSSEDYRMLVPNGARILAGANFALLRPEFGLVRPEALERRQAGGPVRRIFVSMGAADPGGITSRVVEQVLAAAPECAIDVVLGPHAASLGPVRDLSTRHPRISIHLDSDRMAELMRDADIAIGAAGTTSWERCCLGLPSIAIVLAENQSLIAASLAVIGAHIPVTADIAQSLTEGVRCLIASTETRTRMAESAAGIIDGLGSKRVRDVMFSMNARENLGG